MEKTLEIPRITNTTIKYFVDGEYIDNVNVDEVNKIRENVLEHIVATKDASILNRFYFVGHKDTNNGKMGEEIVITMDSFGNLSNLPWELVVSKFCCTFEKSKFTVFCGILCVLPHWYVNIGEVL